MITETDKLECEIIEAIQYATFIHPEDFLFSDKEMLDYLMECFEARKTLLGH